jgi:archaellin
MHPLIRWTIIVFVALVFLAPVLAADALGAAIGAAQSAIESLETFGNAVGK